MSKSKWLKCPCCNIEKYIKNKEEYIAICKCGYMFGWATIIKLRTVNA